jgi:alkaline phosphatase
MLIRARLLLQNAAIVSILSRTILPATLLGLAIALVPAATLPAPAPEPAAGPRNVILVIGDGMDEQQITIARNYLVGPGGRLLLDRLPLRASVQVLTMEDRVDGRPVYVADSANTATSMATGAVTSRGRIATTAGDDRDLPTIVELAEAAGYRTGLVTTASVTDATPAAFAAHIGFRLCENPDDMEESVYGNLNLGARCSADRKASGGAGSIAEQLAESGLDVILGGGRKHFAPLAEGKATSVLDIARARGFQVVATGEALAAADRDQRLLGLFSAGTMPVRLRGEGGRVAEQALPDSRQPGDLKLPQPMTCEPDPAFRGVPDLQQMTDAALAHLAHGNERGFFLMIESASIDKQSHDRKPCGAIGEMAQLEEALASVLAFAGAHPDTLVLVTSDHTHAAQLVPLESLFAVYGVASHSPGRLARIITPDGGLMAINYATSGSPWEEHTGAAVPLFSNARGVGRIPAFLQQPQIFQLMRDYLEIQGPSTQSGSVQTRD